MTLQRKRIRLDGEAYRTTGQVFSVTIGTREREPVFHDIELGLDCVAGCGFP